MQSTTRGEPDKPEMDQYDQDGEIYPTHIHSKCQALRMLSLKKKYTQNI